MKNVLSLVRFAALLFLLLAANSASAFYNPTVGKWISRDPIGEAGGENLSAFCENDPIDSFDAFGDVRVDKDIKKSNEKIMRNGRWVWGWTDERDIVLKKERAAKLKFDKEKCVCVVKKKPELTFVVPIEVVKAGRQAWTVNKTVNDVLYRNVAVYVSGALASSALAHELRRFDVWSTALKSYYGREYEDAAASLTAPSCDELSEKISTLLTRVGAQATSSADYQTALLRQIQIGLEKITTTVEWHAPWWRSEYIEYDLGE